MIVTDILQGLLQLHLSEMPIAYRDLNVSEHFFSFILFLVLD